jgi:hypothetical protein
MTTSRSRAPEVVETARLVLRRSTAGDAAAIFSRYAAFPNLGGDQPCDVLCYARVL